ncbi:ankyrin repeat domain-containing protein [Ralstonia solanacearum]|nr:ankyrin repeat domain-containing protein [Ralstonia solanacearum]
MINEVLRKYSRHVEFIVDEIKDVAQVGAFGSQVIHLASFANCCDDIEELVQAGADVNAIGDLGLRPLHYAVLAGSSDAVHLLLIKGADVRAENEYGETDLPPVLVRSAGGVRG